MDGVKSQAKESYLKVNLYLCPSFNLLISSILNLIKLFLIRKSWKTPDLIKHPVYKWSILPSETTICDVGGGNGHVMLDLVRAFPGFKVVVQDTPDMCVKGREVGLFILRLFAFLWCGFKNSIPVFFFKVVDKRTARGHRETTRRVCAHRFLQGGARARL